MLAQVLAGKLDLNRKAGKAGMHSTHRPQPKRGLSTA